MKYKLFGIIISLFLLYSIVGTPIATSQGIGCFPNSNINFKVTNIIWGNTNHTIAVGPGSYDVPLTVQIEAYGTSCSIPNLEGDLELSGGVTNLNGTHNATSYIQTVTLPSIFSMTFYLNVNNNQLAGNSTYLSYPLYIYWNTTNTSAKYSQEIKLEIPMKGTSKLKYIPKSTILYSGMVNNITFNVQNQGSGGISNITTNIEQESGISILNEPPNINYLGSGKNYTLNVPVFVGGTSGQPITLNIQSTYLNSYGYNTTAIDNVGFYTVTTNQNDVLLSISNQTLLSGIINNATLIIKNKGTYPVENMSIILSAGTDVNLINSTNVINIPYIAPGKIVSIPIYVYVESSTNNVGSLDAQLNYIQNGQSESYLTTLNFLTPGYINLGIVSTTLLPSAPVSGSLFTLTSTFNNYGSQAATAVSFTPKPPKGISIFGSATTFGGTIQPGSPTAFSLSFMVNSTTKPGAYKIPVYITYMNNLNTNINTTIYYIINVTAPISDSNISGNYIRTKYNSTATSQGNGDILYAIVIVIIAIFTYIVYKKRFKNKIGRGHK